MDALEQSALNPELAAVLAKSLLDILRLSAEKTVSSFKKIAAIPRILKVACILVQESKKPGTISVFPETTSSGMTSSQSQGMSYSPEMTQCYEKCMKTFTELFAEYYSVSDDAKLSILCSSLCVTCMFDLFWEENLRDLMLGYVLELMEVDRSSYVILF